MALAARRKRAASVAWWRYRRVRRASGSHEARGSGFWARLEPGGHPRRRARRDLVVSNRPGSASLEVAAEHGVAVPRLRRADFADRSPGRGDRGRAHERGRRAGRAGRLGPAPLPSYFAAFRGRTINVHPSLLPAHGGAGMIGIEVHRSSCTPAMSSPAVTIHEVTAELDAGPILARSRPRAGPATTPRPRRARARRGASAAGGDPAGAPRGRSGRSGLSRWRPFEPGGANPAPG